MPKNISVKKTVIKKLRNSTTTVDSIIEISIISISLTEKFTLRTEKNVEIQSQSYPLSSLYNRHNTIHRCKPPKRRYNSRSLSQHPSMTTMVAHTDTNQQKLNSQSLTLCRKCMKINFNFT